MLDIVTPFFLAVSWSSFFLTAGALATAILAVIAILTAVWNIPPFKRFRDRLNKGKEAIRAEELDQAFQRNINGSLVRVESALDDMSGRLDKGVDRMNAHEQRIDMLEQSKAYLEGLSDGIRRRIT